MEVPREGRTWSCSSTCRVPSPALGPCTTLHHPVFSRSQGGQRAALGGPVHTPRVSAPEAEGPQGTLTAPSPKGWVSLGQCGTQHVLCPLCIRSGLGAAAHRAGGRGSGPWGSLVAHVLSLAPRGSSGEWHVHRRPGSSGNPGQNRASPWEDSLPGGCKHPARHPEAHVGSGA